MQKILRVFLLVVTGTSLVLAGLSHVAGCGSASAPPASIPAPVSSLISVSAPDQDGFVLVSGAPGAVLPNADVVAANVTQGGFVQRLIRVMIPDAYAQVQATTTADDQGAFDLELEAVENDEIGIRQIFDSEISDVTFVIVPPQEPLF